MHLIDCKRTILVRKCHFLKKMHFWDKQGGGSRGLSIGCQKGGISPSRGRCLCWGQRCLITHGLPTRLLAAWTITLCWILISLLSQYWPLLILPFFPLDLLWKLKSYPRGVFCHSCPITFTAPVTVEEKRRVSSFSHFLGESLIIARKSLCCLHLLALNWEGLEGFLRKIQLCLRPEFSLLLF